MWPLNGKSFLEFFKKYKEHYKVLLPFHITVHRLITLIYQTITLITILWRLSLTNIICITMSIQIIYTPAH